MLLPAFSSLLIYGNYGALYRAKIEALGRGQGNACKLMHMQMIWHKAQSLQRIIVCGGCGRSRLDFRSFMMQNSPDTFTIFDAFAALLRQKILFSTNRNVF